MPKCQFTTRYKDYEIDKWIDRWVDFNCPELPLVSGRCIFHDKDYLQDQINNDEHKWTILNRLKRKVTYAISDNEPLLCLGFQLPDSSLSDLIIRKEFTKPVYFDDSRFYGKADFDEANFQGEASFRATKFQGEASFYRAIFQREADFDEASFHRLAFFIRLNFQGEASFHGANFQEAHFDHAIFQREARFYKANFQGETDFPIANFQGRANFYRSEFDKTYFSGEFNGETTFHYVLFEGKEKVIFDVENLSNVSFMSTDLTGVKFSDKARWGNVEYDKFWGGKKATEGKFKIRDERALEEKINKGKRRHITRDFNLGSIRAVYRSLRENYEYRMRYDEAGQFFIREMELKRKYREDVSSKDDGFEVKVKRNNWFRRNLISLTGWYYHLSRYGESLWRPTLAGLVIVFLSTLFWFMQSNPTVEPSLPVFQTDDATSNVTSKFVGLAKFADGAHWLKASERSIADFIPLLPLGSSIEVGIIDYVIKIVGGAVTFGLIAIALRRRFERRYRH